MPIEAKLTFRKHRWVPAVASVLSLLGGILWVAGWPGWLATASPVLLHWAICLIWWQAREMENHWRGMLEKQIAETIGTELRNANKDLLKVEQPPSKDLANAIKEMMD